MDINRVALGLIQWTASATATAGTVTVTKTGIAVLSPKPAQQHVIFGFSVTVDRVVATAAQVLIKDGSTTKFSFWIPVGAYGPIIVTLPRPYACAQGANAVLVVATLGTGVVAVGELYGTTVSS